MKTMTKDRYDLIYDNFSEEYIVLDHTKDPNTDDSIVFCGPFLEASQIYNDLILEQNNEH